MTFFKALEMKILVYIVHKVGKKVVLSGIRCLSDLRKVPLRGGKVIAMTSWDVSSGSCSRPTCPVPSSTSKTSVLCGPSDEDGGRGGSQAQRNRQERQE